MMARNRRVMTLLLALGITASCWAIPFFQDQADQQKQSEKDKKKKEREKEKNKEKKTEEEPLFGGTIGLKSSRKTSDTATMGFNGVTPTGEADQKKLKEPALPADYAKAQQVSFIGVNASQFKGFIKEGKLNTAPPRSSTQSSSGKSK